MTLSGLQTGRESGTARQAACSCCRRRENTEEEETTGLRSETRLDQEKQVKDFQLVLQLDFVVSVDLSGAAVPFSDWPGCLAFTL